MIVKRIDARDRKIVRTVATRTRRRTRDLTDAEALVCRQVSCDGAINGLEMLK